jgi:hypothetical protein
MSAQEAVSRFNKEQTRQLAALADSVRFTKEHLARGETLRVDELPLDAYERRIVDDYRSQLGAIAAAFEKLMDMRLEQSPEADRLARAVADGFDLLMALQAEMGRIVDGYYQEHLQEHSGGNEHL